jgi:predicted metal-dependent enzyme (double-stranded beta helix superfamily)
MSVFQPEDLVARCRASLAESDPALAVRETVAEVVSQPAALLAALGPGPGANTWFQSPDLTVQTFAWPGGLITPPHEHRMWAVIGICQGQEDNTWWHHLPGGVEQVGGQELKVGEVIVLGPDAIHAVANPCHSITVGVHVYGGDINTAPRSEWDYDGRNEHLFDLAAVERVVAGMMARAQQLGRDLDFNEVREGCLAQYRQPA